MSFAIARGLVTVAIGIATAYALSRQCRRPSGWLGRRVARGMNVGHARLTQWGLRHVRIEPTWRLLDIGCGGGRMVRTLAGLAAAGHVDGVDYSTASVDAARETNSDLIAAGRVAIHHGSVSRLPFDEGTFDLITAVETHYYWPDLANDLREVRRVLKPEGRIVMIAEAFRGRPMDWVYRPVMRGLFRANYLSLDEHRAVLTEAGFVDVEVIAEPSRGWMCAIGTH